jgi:hypothetical protein
MNVIKDSNPNALSSFATYIIPRVNILTSTPVKGEFVYDTSTGLLYYANGNTWIQIQSGSF